MYLFDVITRLRNLLRIFLIFEKIKSLTKTKFLLDVSLTSVIMKIIEKVIQFSDAVEVLLSQQEDK